jgi:DNA-binding response OmpR family regulator
MFLDNELFGETERLRLRAQDSLLIAYGNLEFLQGCYTAGCDDYLKEPWSFLELEWRITKLCGEPHRSFAFEWGRFKLQGTEIRSPEENCTLSHPEARILRLLLKAKGDPVSREVLYYALWGRPNRGSSRVVDVHISNLRKKLLRLFPDSKGCIRSVRGKGYLLV